MKTTRGADYGRGIAATPACPPRRTVLVVSNQAHRAQQPRGSGRVGRDYLSLDPERERERTREPTGAIGALPAIP